MQRAFSWKCRALLWAEEARKEGVWSLKKVTRQSGGQNMSVQTRSQRGRAERDGV